MFVTRLHRGQLWHRTAAPTANWTHQVQVGPAMVVSPRGRFHAVAETDGGATVTCLEGMVEVSTGLRDALALQPDQAVAVAADGETCVVTEALEADRPLLVEPAEQPPLPPSGPATTAARPGRRRLAAALVVLALVVLVIVVALVARRGSDRSASSVTTPDRRATSVPRPGVSTTLPPATGSRPGGQPPGSAVPPQPSARARLDSCVQTDGGILALATVSNGGRVMARYRVLVTVEDARQRVLARLPVNTAPVPARGAIKVSALLSFRGPPAGSRCVVRSVTPL
jgi:hypothetical protein